MINDLLHVTITIQDIIIFLGITFSIAIILFMLDGVITEVIKQNRIKRTEQINKLIREQVLIENRTMIFINNKTMEYIFDLEKEIEGKYGGKNVA